MTTMFPRTTQRRALVRALKERKRVAARAGNKAAADRASRALDAMSRRRCRRPALFGLPECARTFAPTSPTQAHCSEDCALLAVAHRQGWVPLPAVGRVRTRRLDAERLERIRGERAGRVALAPPNRSLARPAVPAPDCPAVSEPKRRGPRNRGPRRTVTEVLERRKTTALARMECGHLVGVPVGARSYYCSKCIIKSPAPTGGTGVVSDNLAGDPPADKEEQP